MIHLYGILQILQGQWLLRPGSQGGGLTAKKLVGIFGGDDGNSLLIIMVAAQRCSQNSYNYTAIFTVHKLNQ